MTKVSIIVPVYNGEKLLKRCLKSLLNQTLQDIEIICVNDGSTDNSVKIIKKYLDSRLKLINNNINSGLSVSRNKGMEIATGEYVGFVDCDDWVDNDYFEKLYITAKKYNADIAVSGIIRLNEWHKKYHIKFEKITVTDNFETKLDLCDLPDKSYVWNKIYKATELKKYDLKYEVNKLFEDVIFTPQVLYYLKNLVTVPDTYYNYWRTPNSIVTRKDIIAKRDHDYAFEFAKKFIESHNVNVSLYIPVIKKYKIIGITFFKTKVARKYKEYRLFNFIKWRKLKN